MAAAAASLIISLPQNRNGQDKRSTRGAAVYFIIVVIVVCASFKIVIELGSSYLSFGALALSALMKGASLVLADGAHFVDCEREICLKAYV